MNRNEGAELVNGKSGSPQDWCLLQISLQMRLDQVAWYQCNEFAQFKEKSDCKW